jgi:hypothetical protein
LCAVLVPFFLTFAPNFLAFSTFNRKNFRFFKF